MRWPWQARTENRASFTDALVDAFFTGAADEKSRTALSTSALESCAALYAGAFARAKVEPDVPAVTPAVLALIARDLVRRGESLHLIELEGGALQLRPIGTWDVRGRPAPETWTYRIDLFGPTYHSTKYVPAAAVLHFRYSFDAARPWLGVGPLQWAESTGALAGRLEAGLANEAGAPTAQLVPVPADGGDGGDDDPLKQLKADIAAARGRALLIETTQAGYGAGPAGAPRRDWEQRRIGFEPPDISRSMREDVFGHVLAACGVPPALVHERAEGTAAREALRRWVHLAVEPMGELIASELAAKVDRPGLRLDFSALMASDLAGRGRFLKQLVDSGMTLNAALTLSHLVERGGDRGA